MLRLSAINAPAISVQFAHMVGIPVLLNKIMANQIHTEVCKA